MPDATPQPPQQGILLNDCKKCGGTPMAHSQKGMPAVGIEDSFIVCCDTCTQKSRWMPTDFEAAQDWNQKNRPRG